MPVSLSSAQMFVAAETQRQYFNEALRQHGARVLQELAAREQARREAEVEAIYEQRRRSLQQAYLLNWAQRLPEFVGRAFRNLRIVMLPDYDMLASWRTASKYMEQIPQELIEEIGQAYLDKCIEYSSRQFFSLQELRRMGHPYSIHKAVGAAGIPDYLINVQSGDYLRSWQMVVEKEGQRAVVKVYNTSEHAAYLSGPRGPRARMRIRPIQRAAFEHTHTERELALQRLRGKMRRMLTSG